LFDFCYNVFRREKLPETKEETMRIETITRELYQFDELDEKAKETARDWYRQFIFQDSHDWEHIYEDATTIGSLMGIEIDKIYFTGFSSQGDGACFEGTYAYKKGSVKAVKDYAPEDKELHRIVEELYQLQKKNAYKLQASVKQRGHYMHSGCTEVEVFKYDSGYDWPSFNDDEKELKELLRDFMNWIYNQLEKEHDYLYSAESVDENITINEYEFTSEGKRA
jgi:hypothetical protein